MSRRRGDERAVTLPIEPDPPIGAADDLARHSTMSIIPPGGLLCCYTDGLVERRDQSLDAGIGSLAATMDAFLANCGSRTGRHATLTDDACAEVMRALVGAKPARDDIALVMAYRHHVG